MFIVALSWAYLFSLADGMADNQMPGMFVWLPVDYLMMFFMWAVMMVAMMVPTAIRSIMIYSRIARQATNSGKPIAAIYWFISGYILVWTAFSVVAALLQGQLTRLGLLSPMMTSSSSYFGAGLLIAAGFYQLTPWKDVCLKHCQSPAMFLAGKFGPDITDGIKLGIGHGAYCLGCCWLLMALLFVGGVMNLIWIAIIAFFVLLEKLMPARLRLSRVGAGFMILSGIGYFAFI